MTYQLFKDTLLDSHSIYYVFESKLCPSVFECENLQKMLSILQHLMLVYNIEIILSAHYIPSI